MKDKLIEEHKKVPMLQVRSTPVIKLKDNMGRGGLEFDLLEVFGFMPNKIVIQKVVGRNNAFVVSAVLTPKELAKEKK